MQDKRFPPIGSVSEGTLRTEDLLSSFAFLLGQYAGPDYDGLLLEANEVDPDSEHASDVLANIEDAINEICAPYTYFSAHFGDGACFGIWPDIETLEEDARDGDDVIKVDDLSEVPFEFQGTVMLVNDHGNVTCYSADNGRYSELWSCV